MDNLNNIPSTGNWGDAASKLNDNFNKVRQAVTTVENTSKNNKGYFTSLSALNIAFPSPKAGLTAYVYSEASSTKYYTYNAVNGAWVATSVEAPSVGVDIAGYTKTGGSTKTTKEVEYEIVQLAGIPNGLIPVGLPFSEFKLIDTCIRADNGMNQTLAGYNSIRAKIPHGARKMMFTTLPSSIFGIILASSEDGLSGYITGFSYENRGIAEIDLSLYPNARSVGFTYKVSESDDYFLNFLVDFDASEISGKLNSLSNDIDAIRGISVVQGTNSDMSGPNEWVAGLGNPLFDINSTVAGKMYVDFTSSTNQAVNLNGKLVNGHSYLVKCTARLHSGIESMPLRLGSEFVTPLSGAVIEFAPTAENREYTGIIIANSTNIRLGVIAASNNGSSFEIDNVEFFDITTPSLNTLNEKVITLENTTKGTKSETFNTEQYLQSLSRFDKPLTKIGIVGDSLMANAIGGNIPIEYDEGVNKRPLRLGTNQIARRIYDLVSWNKPVHRRLNDADWTKSGTWAEITTGIFEGAMDIYHSSTSSAAYVEITIPSGKENFAFICRRHANFGKLNITLNGGDISSYGPSQVDLHRTRTGNAYDTGNPFHTVLYSGLPEGDNVIRISKEANTEEVQIWGGFYWTGNTLVIHNTAHGGHNLKELMDQHLQAEVVENDFDAILFELPLMNESGHGTGVVAAQNNLQIIINTIVAGKDVAFMSCQPWGIDPRDGEPNYYANNPDPSMEDYNVALRNTLFLNDKPFVDVFSFFKKKIENRGGTLEGGEGGIWYTWDGQHQSEDGMREYWNLIRFLFENKPIRYE